MMMAIDFAGASALSPGAAGEPLRFHFLCFFHTTGSSATQASVGTQWRVQALPRALSHASAERLLCASPLGIASARCASAAAGAVCCCTQTEGFTRRLAGNRQHDLDNFAKLFNSRTQEEGGPCRQSCAGARPRLRAASKAFEKLSASCAH